MDEQARVRVLRYLEFSGDEGRCVVGFGPGVFGAAFFVEMAGLDHYRQALGDGSLVACPAEE